MCMYNHTHIYTQVHLECGKKVLFFLQLISKSKNAIYFRFITCKVKHFKSLELTANESKKIVSQNITIFTFEFQ